MKFVRLVLTDNSEVLVNPSRIASIENGADPGTFMVFVGEGDLYYPVKSVLGGDGSISDIAALIEAAW